MRVRFLTHVMGLPGPESVYHEGQVAEIPDALVAVIEAAMVRDHASGWFEEYEGAAEQCPRCGNDFAPGDIARHRTWLHGEELAKVAAERRNLNYPKGEGDLTCFDCGRSFKTESGIKQHRTKVHHDRRAGPAPRSEGDREQGNAAGDQSPRGFAGEPAVDRPAESGQ